MTKRLTKRNAPEILKEEEAPHCPQPATPSCGEPETFTMPDPEAEAAAAAPGKRRNGLPPEKIGCICGQCGNSFAVFVEHADDYDEKARIEIFKKRGSSYKPQLCRWCVKRMPKAARAKLAS